MGNHGGLLHDDRVHVHGHGHYPSKVKLNLRSKNTKKDRILFR